MIKTYIKNIIGVFFLISLLNCNYSIPEKDKHPDMESFPKLSGVNFKMDSINDSIVVLKYDSEHYYAIGSSSLFVYDGNYPYGYAYYRLKIGDQTINFKYYNDNLEQAKLKQWKNPSNDK